MLHFEKLCLDERDTALTLLAKQVRCGVCGKFVKTVCRRFGVTPLFFYLSRTLSFASLCWCFFFYFRIHCVCVCMFFCVHMYSCYCTVFIHLIRSPKYFQTTPKEDGEKTSHHFIRTLQHRTIAPITELLLKHVHTNTETNCLSCWCYSSCRCCYFSVLFTYSIANDLAASC